MISFRISIPMFKRPKIKPQDKWFYIVSIWHSHNQERVRLWMKNENLTETIGNAGRFSEKQIKENPDHYNNGNITIAVSTDLITNQLINYIPNDDNTLPMLRKLAYKKKFI